MCMICMTCGGTLDSKFAYEGYRVDFYWYLGSGLALALVDIVCLQMPGKDSQVYRIGLSVQCRISRLPLNPRP